MISRMYKLTMLVYHKEYEAFLEKLREIGVVHVVEKNSGSADSPELQSLLSLHGRCERVMKRLESVSRENDNVPAEPDSAERVIEKCEELFRQREQLLQEKVAVEKDVATMSVWGNFEDALVQRLSDE